MKKLFIVTTTFPYGTKESFIENEIEYYTYFDEVYFLPIYARGEVRGMDYPENVKWLRVKRYKKWQLLMRLYKVITSLVFIKEIFALTKQRRLTFKNVFDLCLMLAQSYYYSAQIAKIIKPIAVGNNNYFYSYWMVEHAVTGILLSKRIHFDFLFTRAHRYDLYASRRESGYIPCRSFIMDNMNLVCPISEDGVSYLNDGRHHNIVLSRLGTKDFGIAPFNLKQKDEINILSCSWCVEVKRLDLIIQALSLIKNIYINWTHIGDGPLLNELESLSKESLGSNIKYNFVGKKTNKEVIDYYKATNVDLFINVSSSEGIPVSIMEASSFGIPTIATAVGGTPEIVIHGKNGFLLEPDFNVNDLVSFIIGYSQKSQEEITDLRRNARSFWENHYSASKNFSSFFKKIANG